jgi:transcriptional regulator with XRE-family HTH domain
VLILKFAEKFQQYRAARNWVRSPQEELAECAGVTTRTLRSLQNPRYNARLQTLEKVASALGVAALHLVEEVSDDEGRRRVKAYEMEQAQKKRTTGEAVGEEGGAGATGAHEPPARGAGANELLPGPPPPPEPEPGQRSPGPADAGEPLGEAWRERQTSPRCAGVTNVSLDPVSRALVDLMRANGYRVDIRQRGETYCVVAEHPTEAHQTAEGPDVHEVLCALAERCGIDLENG